MTRGTILTLWSVRVAGICYVLAIAGWLVRRPWKARVAWTLGVGCYLGHAAAAFSFYHGWSHDAAYQETARQTAELFGVRWGGGLYFNYVFTAVWTFDAIWSWWDYAGYRSRSKWIAAAIHGFLAFMFMNATVVFASGWTRWLGAASTVGLLLLLFRRRMLRP